MITGDLGLFGERLAVALGFVTLTLFACLGLTCRSFVALADKLKVTMIIKSKSYQGLFKLHSFFWYSFFLVLFLHMLTGVMHTRLPQAGDPDAVQHLWIIIFAGSVTVSIGLTFSNCRTFVGLISFFKDDNILTGAYGKFYRFHSYFWVLLLVAVVSHFTASYVHVGFWPMKLE